MPTTHQVGLLLVLAFAPLVALDVASGSEPQLEGPRLGDMDAAGPAPVAGPPQDWVHQTRHAAFLSGDFGEFDAWTRQWLEEGSKAVGVPVPATPHAGFWAELVTRPVRRKALLGFLREARAQRLALADPLASPPSLPTCGSACRRALIAYLDAFEAPRHLPDQRALMDTDKLVYRSHQPDEAIVALSGDLGLVTAIPSLKRCLRAERRFYWIQTDYNTYPQEVGALFEAALWALVKIARTHPAQRSRIRDWLRSEREALVIPEGARQGSESFWLEVYDDDDYGPDVEPVQATAAVRRLVSRVWADPNGREPRQQVSKVPFLDRALAELEGD
jgi:hypothetical protein